VGNKDILCKVRDNDGDLFIVYKDGTAQFSFEDVSEDHLGSLIKWELQQDEKVPARYYFYYNNESYTEKLKTDYDFSSEWHSEQNSFEVRLVEAILKAQLDIQMDDLLANSEPIK
jgi:hypothetical protein